MQYSPIYSNIFHVIDENIENCNYLRFFSQNKKKKKKIEILRIISFFFFFKSVLFGLRSMLVVSVFKLKMTMVNFCWGNMPYVEGSN